MTVADVASVAASAENGSFLRVSGNCCNSRATVAATVRPTFENACKRSENRDFESTAPKRQFSAGFRGIFHDLSTTENSPRSGVPGGRGFPPYRGNPLTRSYRLGVASR